MKKYLIISTLAVALPFAVNAQCTTTDATSCVCADASNDCDLLPDITVSWEALEQYMSGPTEYSQTGNGANNGRLRITGSTPNIGYGAFTVRGSDSYVCGTDTITGTAPSVCPDGTAPKQLIVQRIYHKNGNTMTYWDRWAGAMTYHPTHGHNHVDDWGVFTLRIQDVNEPNPLNWPIVGDGAKLGFCLMDYGTCSYYAGHCKDVNTDYGSGTTMLNQDFPNYGLGGGNYGCSPVEQGITSGYTDIYSENLDGMWINIPPGTCNGQYWIVADIDPADFFLESDETNNYTAIPFMLTQQDPPGNPQISITSNVAPTICAGETVTLTATAGTSFQWSTGETTQSITVSAAGNYTCTVTNLCGTGTSAPFTVVVNPAPGAPTLTADEDTVCMNMSTTLTATGNMITWYDDNMIEVGTGNTFTTPSLTASTTYYASDENYNAGSTSWGGKLDNSGGGGNYTGDQWLIFDALMPITIKSVKVYANGAGDRTFQILDQGGNLVQQGTFNLADGEQRVDVDFAVPAGNNFEFRVNGTTDMYRNNSGVNYPYDIQDTLSIHSSSAGGQYYYFFYDWEVAAGESSCPGPSSSITVEVDNCVGLDEVNLSEHITVFPNPNNGEFTYQFNVPGTADFSLEVVDMMGKSLFRKDRRAISGSYQENINLGDIPVGVYFVRTVIEGRSYVEKLVIR